MDGTKTISGNIFIPSKRHWVIGLLGYYYIALVTSTLAGTTQQISLSSLVLHTFPRDFQSYKPQRLFMFLILHHSLPHHLQYLFARCQKVHKGIAWESKLVLQVATCFLQWQKTFPTKVLIFNASKVLFFMLYNYILSRRKDLRSINSFKEIVSDNFYQRRCLAW